MAQKSSFRVLWQDIIDFHISPWVGPAGYVTH